MQRLFATREPTAEQLEVGRAALAEILRLEAPAERAKLVAHSAPCVASLALRVLPRTLSSSPERMEHGCCR